MAENVPETVFPLCDVTFHWKLLQEEIFAGDAEVDADPPESDAQLPIRAEAVVLSVVGDVGVVGVRGEVSFETRLTSHAATATEAATIQTGTFIRRIAFTC